MAEMKVARATQTEINNLRDFLNDLQSLEAHFSYEFARTAVMDNKEEFPVLKNLTGSDDSQFLEGISKWLNNNRWEVVLFNLDVLMSNCVDLNADNLEFNERLQKGLTLLHEQEAEASKA